MHLPARALTRLPPASTSMGLNCAWGIVACAGWGHLLVERVGGAHTVHVRVCVFVFVFVFVCSCASSVVGIVRSFVSCSCFAVVEVLRARVLSVTVCALSRAHHLHLSAVWRYGPDSWGRAGSLGS
jgi:hypothetical protein